MSRKYFLDDGIEYFPDSGELFVDGHIENLQSLENKLLLHFVTHPNQLIGKEDLYKVGWNGRIFGDNPLSKAISNLRAKLKDNPRNPRYIKTVPKKGFRFVSEVSKEPIVNIVLVTQDALKTTVKPARTIILIILLVLTFLVAAVMLLSTPPVLEVSNIKQLTHADGQANTPNLSADGSHVVFSRQINKDASAQIIIIPVNGGLEKILTNSHYDNFSPKWHSDGRRILYHRFDPQRCEIALMTLDKQMNITSDQVLTTCGKYTRSLGLTWGPDNTIFYTDIDQQNAPLTIYKQDIGGGKRQTFAIPGITKGRGYYRISYDSTANVLHALLSVDWYDTAVVTLSLSGEVLNQHLVKTPLFAVSSYQGSPVFKTEGNHIIHLKDGNKYRLMQSPLQPVFDPDFNDTPTPTMTFVGGVYHNAELLLIDLKKKTSTVMSSGDEAHKFPVMTKDDTLYFISDRTGVYQIWRSRQGKQQQLSQFATNLQIEDIAVSDDERFIALTIEDKVYVYQLNNTTLILDQPWHIIYNSANPHFTPDSTALWTSQDSKGTYTMNALKLSDKSQAASPVAYGYLGVFDNHTGEHYVFKNNQPGIWKLQNNQLTWVSDAPLITSVHSVVLNNGVLTYFADDNASLMQWQLSQSAPTQLSDKAYRYVTAVNGKPDQFIVTNTRFGNTNIYLTRY